MTDFEPRIVAFCCDHSGYPAADMAGALKLEWPTQVTIVRVPCAGRIETLHLVKALERGAEDGYAYLLPRSKGCGKNISRDMKPTCLEWCPAAQECVGTEKYERLMKSKQKK